MRKFEFKSLDVEELSSQKMMRITGVGAASTDSKRFLSHILSYQYFSVFDLKKHQLIIRVIKHNEKV